MRYVLFGYRVAAGNQRHFDEIFQIASRYIPNQDVIDSMALAIKEMLGNIREHSYHLNEELPIDFSIEVTRREVVVVIIDVGAPWRADGFDYLPDAERQLFQLMQNGAERGRGQYIMYLLSDSLEYQLGGRFRRMAWHLPRNGGNGR